MFLNKYTKHPLNFGSGKVETGRPIEHGCSSKQLIQYE